MTHGRTTLFARGVCIGTLLLFCSHTLADVTEASTTPSGRFDSQTSTLQGATTTLLTRVSLTRQSAREKDERNVEPTTREAHEDKEDGSRDNVDGDESAKRDEEKSDVPLSREEIESPSSPSSDGSRRTRYGEISAESSGKSTSTKAASERPVGLSRTNELTIATTKPALNDSKQDNKKSSANATLEESSDHEGTSDAETVPSTKEKLIAEKLATSTEKNPETEHDTGVESTSGNHTLPEESSVNAEGKRILATSTEGTTTVASIGVSSSKPTSEDVAKSDDRKDKINKSDHKEAVPKMDPKKDKSTTSADLTDQGDAEEQRLENRDRELTTVRGVRYQDLPETKKDATPDPATTASEAFDLEKIDETGHEGGVSLINDTYVNYKSQTEKEPKVNGTGDADADGSRGKGDPKGEVEVVEHVTHQPILKIISVANGTAANDSRVDELSGGQTGAVYNQRGGSIGAKDKDHEEQRVLSSANGADHTEEWKSISGPEAQVKSLETTTLSIQPEGRTSPALKVTPSPIPQGRTIGFSGANEFPSIEVKSTAATKIDGELGGTTAAPATQSTPKVSRKPYPYMKSSAESLVTTTAVSLKPKKDNSDVVAETSAYENTIGREESEKKFIVTEASVVIENSIQQQKPDEKRASEFTNSTTESSSLTSVTVMPITRDEVGPTNETFPLKPSGGVKPAEKTEDPRSKEDDAPATKSQEKAIAARDEGYDVTGNGITEVGLPLEAASGRSEEMKSRADGAAESSTPTTPKVAFLNISDIQMEPEEAMMIRSTFAVTESTIMPLDPATEVNKSTMSMNHEARATTTTVEDTTESTPDESANVTLQHQLQPSANQSTEPTSTTLNPDESSIPTTTSVEFEFVGLTEPVSSNVTNSTEKNVEGRTYEEQTTLLRITSPATISDSFARNSSTDAATTTMKPEDSTELPTTMIEDETPTTDRVSITANETTEIKVPPAITRPAVEQQSDHTESAGNEVTTSAIDVTGAVTNAETAGVTENPSASKDSSFDANVTETSAPGVTELPPHPGVTTPPATPVTKSPSAPFSSTTSTSQPEVRWSTPNSTGSPEVEEDVTKSIQTLSQDEITSLVKIVMEGTLQDICPRMKDIKNALANVLTNGMDKLVSWKQIVIHQDPCLDPTSPSPTTPTDVPLTSILVYVVDEDDKFDAAMTKILPSLDKVFRDFPVRVRKFVLVQETDSGNAIAVVVVSSVAFICLVLLAGLLFIMRKRQTRFNYGERCRPVSLDAYSLDSVSAYSSVRRKVAPRTSKRSYGNPTFEDSSAIPSHPLNFAGLSSFCNDVNVIDEEFSNIPQVSVKIDELPPGTEVKNRYANVIPLPETRVPLERLNNDATTEYINASYVRGPKNATKYYIACQAPLDSTVTDFWRMIWEQQCKVIIMLTDLVENGVEKCTEYIPPSEVTDCHRLYGDYQVSLKKRETKEKYAISTLHLKNLENNTFREVFHIWYLWPVNGIESDGAGLIAVLLEARALQRGGPGPIVVHCSSGTGRTGTLIALDLGIRQYEITRTVDVPRVVYTIRRDRAGAVQTKEQYAFIYKALNLYATKLAGGVLEST